MILGEIWMGRPEGRPFFISNEGYKKRARSFLQLPDPNLLTMKTS